MSRLDEMLGFLPEFLRDFRELREIITAEEPEFDMLVENLENTLNSMFIETATEMGLEKYEKLLNIKPISTNIEERRASVMALWQLLHRDIRLLKSCVPPSESGTM